VYDSTSATAADIRARHVAKEIAAVTAKGGYCPTPEEIAERAAAIRRSHHDANGVLIPETCRYTKRDYGQAEEARRIPGIKVISTSALGR